MKHIILALLICISLSNFTIAKESNEIAAKNTTEDKDFNYRQIAILSSTISLIEEHYVKEIPFDQLITNAINGIFQELDPHSSFLNQENYEELKNNTTGTFPGIGIEVMIEGDELHIISPIGNGPAAKAGIIAGDRITKVDNVEVKKIGGEQSLTSLKGKTGTSVTLQIRRKTLKEELTFKLIREHISTNSVHFSQLANNIVYSKIDSFQANTSKDYATGLNAQKEKSEIKGLILDLRNNPGGLLTQAIQIADIFLTEGDIVSTKTKNNKATSKYVAHDVQEDNNFPLAVLINNGSASASEIVAGAIQDNNRGIIIGTKSFGKGSVQTIFPLNNGQAIRITTANYYTPSGKSIQALGIKPDVVVENNMVAKKNDSEIDLKNHLDNPVALAKNEKIIDNQLKAAQSILQAIILQTKSFNNKKL